MNLKNMLWLAAIIFAIAAIIDFFDNNILKLAGTICIAIAFALLATAQNNPRKKNANQPFLFIFMCSYWSVCLPFIELLPGLNDSTISSLNTSLSRNNHSLFPIDS